MGQPARSHQGNLRREAQGDHKIAINTRLELHGLSPIKRTGTYQGNEVELDGIVSVSQNGYYATVEFDTIFPDGKHHPFFIQFGNESDQHIPNVIVPVVNGTHLVLTRQHRPTMLVREHSWVREFPRGFIVTGLQPTILDHKLRSKMPELIRKQDGMDGAIGVVGRKLVSLLLNETVEITSFRPLNTLPEDDGLSREAAIAEDTGRSTGLVFYWLLELQTPDLETLIASTQGPKQMELCIIPWQDAIRKRRELDIIDEATMTGLQLFLEATNRIQW